MRVAILDLGTNTFHLLIADIGKAPSLVFQETRAVKLGEGGISKAMITSAAFERGISALKKFQSEIDYYKPDIQKVVATSAIRTASNGQEFIEKVRSETGIDPQIIDGNKEAMFIYKGVREAVQIPENSLIIDIGGGSVEFIICNQQGIFWKKSYAIGAARLMDQFHHSDPISQSDIKAIYQFLEDTLPDLKRELEFYKPSVLIGSAGAFETFAEFADPPFHGTFQQPQYAFDFSEFQNISKRILQSSHDERAAMPEIIPVRVDMIVPATILTRYILEISGIKKLKLSMYSLKEGVLFDLFGQYRA